MVVHVYQSSVDYHQVPIPGIKLIGAHNFVRPKHESYPHHWTHHDDCNAILDMTATKQIDVMSVVSRVENFENASQIYNEQ